MVVVLNFTARDPSALIAELRSALSPAAAAAKPGRNPAFPGLVVGLSSTGAALGGPSANLANLFQIVSPSRQLDGSLHVSAVWTNTQVDFGSDVDATLVAYLVAGSAPDTNPVSQANIDVISNTVEVPFRVSSVTDPGAAVAAPPAAGPVTTMITSATTTSVRPAATTTTTRAVTSTVATTTTTPAPITTPVPATTTTTRPNILGIPF